MKIETAILDHRTVDSVYFFTSYDGRDVAFKNELWFNLNRNLSEDDRMKFLKLVQSYKSKVKEIIRANGFKFYTTDADDESKCHGWYLKNWFDGTKTVDFEPMDDFTELDLGHIKMYYKEGGKWKQL